MLIKTFENLGSLQVFKELLSVLVHVDCETLRLFEEIYLLSSGFSSPPKK